MVALSANAVALLRKVIYIVLQSLTHAKEYLLQKTEYAELAFIFITCQKKK